MNELFQSAKTKEGISVFNFERKSGPISIIFNFKGGSVEDPAGKEGLAHFTEHMFVSGTKSFPSKDLLALELEKIGAVFSAKTSSENIQLEIMLADKADLKKAMSVAREIFSESLFLENTFQQEKKTIFTEIGLANSDHKKHVGDLYRKAFFDGNLLEKSNLGTPESLNRISINDLKNYFYKLKTPSRLSIVSAGNVSINEITKALSGISFDGNSDFVSDKKISVLKNISEESSVDNVYIICGYKMERISFGDYVVSRILQYYLSGSRASVLMKKLRYERGLVYFCSVKPALYEHFTNFYVSTSFKKENEVAVMDIIKNELEDIKNKGVNQELLDDTIERLIKTFPIKHESSMDFAQDNSILLTCFDKPYTVNYFIDVLKGLKTKDVKDFANKNFTEKNFAYAKLMPK